MNEPAVTADSILTRYFTERRTETATRRQERLERVERALRHCMEDSGEHVLTDDEEALLWAERQFAPAGAVARCANPDTLLFVLAAFLTPGEQLRDLSDLRVQVTEAAGIARWMLDTGAVDRIGSACALIEVETAVQRVRRRLRLAAHH